MERFRWLKGLVRPVGGERPLLTHYSLGAWELAKNVMTELVSNRTSQTGAYELCCYDLKNCDV